VLFEGKYLKIYNDLNTLEVKELNDLVKSSKFTRNVYSSSIKENLGFFHYGANPTEDELKKYSFYNRTIKLLPDGYLFINALINSQSFGDQTFIHRDMDEDGLTILFYIMDYEWNPDFGGETVFYDDNKEIVCSIIPKGNKYLIVDSRILHVGRCPNRLFIGDRHTLGIRFRK